MSKREWLTGSVGLLSGIVLTIIASGFYFSTNHSGIGMGDMMKMMGKGGSGAMMGSQKSQASGTTPTESQEIDHEAHHAS